MGFANALDERNTALIKR